MTSNKEAEVECYHPDDEEHNSTETLHNFENCGSCDCAIVEERGRHCQHCYHCAPCSSAVARGSRPCPSVFDKDSYPPYLNPRAKEIDFDKCHDLVVDTDGDGKDKLDPDNRQEFQQPQSETYTKPELRDGVYYFEDGYEVDAAWLDNMPSPAPRDWTFNNDFPPVPDQAARDKDAKELIEKLWGGDIRNMPGYHTSSEK